MSNTLLVLELENIIERCKEVLTLIPPRQDIAIDDATDRLVNIVLYNAIGHCMDWVNNKNIDAGHLRSLYPWYNDNVRGIVESFFIEAMLVNPEGPIDLNIDKEIERIANTAFADDVFNYLSLSPNPFIKNYFTIGSAVCFHNSSSAITDKGLAFFKDKLHLLTDDLLSRITQAIENEYRSESLTAEHLSLVVESIVEELDKNDIPFNDMLYVKRNGTTALVLTDGPYKNVK